MYYLSIKLDFENRIDIIGEQLNSAYKLDVEQKQNFKNLTSYFLKTARLFQGSGNSMVLNMASLFLKKNLVYNYTNMANYLKDEVKIIYEFQYSNNKENFEEVSTSNISKEQ